MVKEENSRLLGATQQGYLVAVLLLSPLLRAGIGQGYNYDKARFSKFKNKTTSINQV
jgi:hypothetical protein